MKKIILLSLFLFAILFSGCAIVINKEAEIKPETGLDEDPNTKAYLVTFHSTWNKENHPEFYPTGASFSPFVLAMKSSDK